MFGFFHVSFLELDLQFQRRELTELKYYLSHFISRGISLRRLSLVILKFVLTETVFARKLH